MNKEVLTIKGSSDLRGELILPSVGRRLVANKEVPISEETYWSHDVQIALRKKMITLEGGEVRDKDLMRDFVTIVSTKNRELVLPSLPITFKTKGQKFSTSRKTFLSADIQQAIRLGLVEVEEPEELEELEEETVPKKKSSKKKKITKKKATKKKSSKKKTTKKKAVSEENEVDELLKQFSVEEEDKVDEILKRLSEGEEPVDGDVELLDDADEYKDSGRAKIFDNGKIESPDFKPYLPTPDVPQRGAVGKAKPKIKAIGGKTDSDGHFLSGDDGVII